MIKRSRRALVIAASFAVGLSAVGPAAHAGLLGGGSDTAVEGVGLPVGGDLLGGDLLGSVLGGNGLLGSVLGGTGLLGNTGLLGGSGLPLVGNVLGGEGGGPLGIVEGVLGGEGGPLGIVGGVLGGDDSVLAAEGLADTLEVLPLGIVPGGESILEILDAFSGSGSIVPGLQVLTESGVLGVLGSL